MTSSIVSCKTVSTSSELVMRVDISDKRAQLSQFGQLRQDVVFYRRLKVLLQHFSRLSMMVGGIAKPAPAQQLPLRFQGGVHFDRSSLLESAAVRQIKIDWFWPALLTMR